MLVQLKASVASSKLLNNLLSCLYLRCPCVLHLLPAAIPLLPAGVRPASSPPAHPLGGGWGLTSFSFLCILQCGVALPAAQQFPELLIETRMF
ncbi:hypothetical protein CLOP_g7424 [Closterium sp. NIES-67]|nr:hypothetical protein CLOP_g7424 [Closterium sp. NIES-67]